MTIGHPNPASLSRTLYRKELQASVGAYHRFHKNHTSSYLGFADWLASEYAKPVLSSPSMYRCKIGWYEFEVKATKHDRFLFHLSYWVLLVRGCSKRDRDILFRSLIAQRAARYHRRVSELGWLDPSLPMTFEPHSPQNSTGVRVTSGLSRRSSDTRPYRRHRGTSRS